MPIASGRSVPAMLLVIALASACDPGGSSGPGASRVPVTSEPTAAPPTGAPTPSAASAATTPSPNTSAEPPPASMAVEGGDPVVGQLGSFTWGDGGSDSPWLPGAPIAVGAGERLTVVVADAAGVAEWTARRVPAGTANGTGAVGVGQGGSKIAFAAPPPGVWSVQVVVLFASDLGSATYYWQVAVR